MSLLGVVLRDIRIEHTLFAMPFAVMSAFVAAGGLPDAYKLLLLLIALVFARSAAMAFNRVCDARFDKTNPRTASRPLASGKADPRFYIFFVFFNSAAFILSAYFINRLAFTLSPIALAVIFFYSFTKRVTSYSHFFLGFALSLAPIGAWVAITGEIGLASITIGAAVIFWLVGLDIIYSCQDVSHDREMGLYSFPSRFGVRRALIYSKLSHLIMVVFLLISFSISPHLGTVYLLGVGVTAALLWYEHSLVKPDNLKRVNAAFFNVNGVISVGLMAFTIADTLIK